MKKLYWILFLVPVIAFAPPKLVKTKITEGITVLVPEELKPMSPEDMAQRYPSVRAPLGAFTNEDRVVDLSVNISATQWPDSDLSMAKEFFKSGIYNLYDRIEMLNEGIYEIHKKKFIFFEFTSRVNGSKMQMGAQEPIYHYTYIQYLVEPGRAIVFSFICPGDQIEQWQPTAKAIMKSVRIK